MLRKWWLLPIAAWLGLALAASAGSPALAEGKCSGKLFGCVASAKKTVTSQATTGDSGGKGGNVRLRLKAPAQNDFSTFKTVADGRAPDAIGCDLANAGTDACVVRLSTDDGPAPSGATVVTITPYQAALMAAAYLPLQPGQPTVGPPAELNKWKMAAVGYPLWIWAEGNLDPGPVSQSVSGLSVSLDADLAKITYDMGDGTTITCGSGTPWHKGKIKPGTPSPDCGHTYRQPSLPEGNYTITATTHWSVAWTAGGQSGTIPFTQSSTTTLPVGEVQTLVR